MKACCESEQGFSGSGFPHQSDQLDVGPQKERPMQKCRPIFRGRIPQNDSLKDRIFSMDSPSAVILPKTVLAGRLASLSRIYWFGNIGSSDSES